MKEGQRLVFTVFSYGDIRRSTYEKIFPTAPNNTPTDRSGSASASARVELAQKIREYHTEAGDWVARYERDWEVWANHIISRFPNDDDSWEERGKEPPPTQLRQFFPPAEVGRRRLVNKTGLTGSLFNVADLLSGSHCRRQPGTTNCHRYPQSRAGPC